MANITLTKCTRVPTTDFIAPTTPHNLIEHSKHHRILLSNLFEKAEQVKNGLGPNASEPLIKSKVFEGNRPSTSIMSLLTSATLGGCFFLSLSWVGSVNRTL